MWKIYSKVSLKIEIGRGNRENRGKDMECMGYMWSKIYQNTGVWVNRKRVKNQDF